MSFTNFSIAAIHSTSSECLDNLVVVVVGRVTDNGVSDLYIVKRYDGKNFENGWNSIAITEHCLTPIEKIIKPGDNAIGGFISGGKSVFVHNGYEIVFKSMFEYSGDDGDDGVADELMYVNNNFYSSVLGAGEPISIKKVCHV